MNSVAYPSFAGLFLTVSIFGFMKPDFAFAEGGAFSIEPLYTEVALSEEMQEHSFEITLSNNTASDTVFSVSVVDFGTLDESGGVIFLGGGSDFEKRYGLASWMRLGSERFIVPAGESEHIPVTIENRESLSPGGHYGAVLFQIKRGEDSFSPDGSSVVALDPSFAALVFVRKSGGAVERIDYKGVNSVESDIFGITDKLFIRFQNAGNVHLVPRGRVTVTDVRGRVVRKGVINGESGRVLPESFRAYPVKLKTVAAAWLPGAYETTVEWRYDGREEMAVVEEGKSFPIILNALWVGGGAAFVTFVWIYLKKRLKKGKTEKSEMSGE